MEKRIMLILIVIVLFFTGCGNSYSFVSSVPEKQSYVKIQIPQVNKNPKETTATTSTIINTGQNSIQILQTQLAGIEIIPNYQYQPPEKIAEDIIHTVDAFSAIEYARRHGKTIDYPIIKTYLQHIYSYLPTPLPAALPETSTINTIYNPLWYPTCISDIAITDNVHVHLPWNCKYQDKLKALLKADKELNAHLTGSAALNVIAAWYYQYLQDNEKFHFLGIDPFPLLWLYGKALGASKIKAPYDTVKIQVYPQKLVYQRTFHLHLMTSACFLDETGIIDYQQQKHKKHSWIYVAGGSVFDKGYNEYFDYSTNHTITVPAPGDYTIDINVTYGGGEVYISGSVRYELDIGKAYAYPTEYKTAKVLFNYLKPLFLKWQKTPISYPSLKKIEKQLTEEGYMPLISNLEKITATTITGQVLKLEMYEGDKDSYVEGIVKMRIKTPAAFVIYNKIAGPFVKQCKKENEDSTSCLYRYPELATNYLKYVSNYLSNVFNKPIKTFELSLLAPDVIQLYYEDSSSFSTIVCPYAPFTAQVYRKLGELFREK